MKVAILTIHKIINCGSALQTYALQTFLERKFPDIVCEIVDYKFPNEYHRKERNKKLTTYQIIRNRLHRIKEGISLFAKIKKIKFEKFWNNEFRLSSPYPTRKSIFKKTPTSYDIHILGSDQVWNTNSLCGDDIFLFSYLDDKDVFFSYASSFGITEISPKYLTTFKILLSRFKALGVRENNAIELLSSIGLRDKAQLVCDPTFLLGPMDYDQLSNKSKLNIQGDYILVYYLNYAFDPMPAIKYIVEKACRELNCKVIFIGRKFKDFDYEFLLLRTVDPYDFVYLFKHAKFVVTSSFHGTAFSIIHRKPFISVAPRKGDSRICDILEYIGLESCLVYNDQLKFDIIHENQYTEKVEGRLNYFINSSKEFLISNINRYR